MKTQSHNTLKARDIIITNKKPTTIIEYNDIGYTPDNYKTLFKSTGLSVVAFCKQFGIVEQTFYNHRKGKRSMNHNDWSELYQAVIEYHKELDKQFN